MCHQIFRSTGNLRRHQNAELLGITKAPIQTTLNKIHTRLTQSSPPTVQILAGSLFLYDPLGATGRDTWFREQFLAEIEKMPVYPTTACFVENRRG
jgi:hypothetical protein